MRFAVCEVWGSPAIGDSVCCGHKAHCRKNDFVTCDHASEFQGYVQRSGAIHHCHDVFSSSKPRKISFKAIDERSNRRYKGGVQTLFQVEPFITLKSRLV